MEGHKMNFIYLFELVIIDACCLVKRKLTCRGPEKQTSRRVKQTSPGLFNGCRNSVLFPATGRAVSVQMSCGQAYHGSGVQSRFGVATGKRENGSKRRENIQEPEGKRPSGPAEAKVGLASDSGQNVGQFVFPPQGGDHHAGKSGRFHRTDGLGGDSNAFGYPVR